MPPAVLCYKHLLPGVRKLATASLESHCLPPDHCLHLKQHTPTHTAAHSTTPAAVMAAAAGGYRITAGVPKAGSEDAQGIRQHATWSPYDDNGGTTLAVAGADYCIVAASTRMSTGYSILTRRSSKILQLTDKCVIASAGCQVDMKALQKLLQARNVMFQHNHGKPMSCKATAQLLSNTLYYKRFFPYYTFNLCAGLDDEGRGAVYTYDAIGSYERTGYSCQGSGKDLMQPVLDNQLKAASPLLVPARNSITELPLEQAIDLVKDAFVSAGERDIYTGDYVEILVITKEGIRREELQLKLD